MIRVGLKLGGRHDDTTSDPYGSTAATVIQQAFAERDGEIERLREALKPLVFFDMGKDEDEGAPFTTQDVWETIFKDRVQDWFDFADIEAARQALAAKGDSRG